METEKDTQCPNCAELWKRLDQLAEEKAKAQKWQGANMVVSIVLFILILANLILALIRNS